MPPDRLLRQGVAAPMTTGQPSRLPVRARETFWYGRRLIRRGDLIDRGDPVYARCRESLFDTIEQATAAPGEKRATRLPRRG